MDEVLKYRGSDEGERIENAQLYSLVSNIIKKLGRELTYNEQFALNDGLEIFIHRKHEQGDKLNILEFKGKAERDRIETALLYMLVQNMMSRFETTLTEDECNAIRAILNSKLKECKGP